jgi:phosphate starvation-inducible PhoH-like protein
LRKSEKRSAVSIVYRPRNEAQKKTVEIWDRARVIILIGRAGTGKTTAGLAGAIADVIAGRSARAMLSRPTTGVEEELGYFPGDLNEKLGPWMAPFSDVMGDLSEAKLASLGPKIETVPIGMLRGRTVSNATLIIDEAQNATWSQLICAVTRVGRGGRVVLCGDPDQTDLKIGKGQEVPLSTLAKKLTDVPGVFVVRCTAADQVRDPFVNLVLAAVGKS